MYEAWHMVTDLQAGAFGKGCSAHYEMYPSDLDPPAALFGLTQDLCDQLLI